MSHVYQYPAVSEKLNQVRIAELLPASNVSDPLHCRLLPLSLDTRPIYNALSYTWGEATQCAPIIVDSKDRAGVKGREIAIRENLDAALRQIRRKDSSLPMWIDSICIDQGDLEERGKQAGKMTDIYKIAREVYVWLGVAKDEGPSAWKLINDIVDGTLASTLQIMQDPARLTQFSALHTLFRRPYWSRIWVVQEVNSGGADGKPVSVYCGEDSMPWTKLESVCDRLREAKKLLAYVNPSDATSNNTLLNGGPKSLQLSRFSDGKDTPGLFELLLSHKSKDSTDAKDKVYALVGISSSQKTFEALNYEWPEREAFIYAAKHIIQITNRLDVICVRQNDDNKYNLPSWVPDWERRNNFPNHRIMGLHIRQPPFNASRESNPNYKFLENESVLQVSGYAVDTIGGTGDPFYLKGDEHADNKLSQTLSTFQTWWEIYAKTRGPKASTQEFSSTVFGGKWASYTEPLLPHQRFEALSSLTRTLLPSENVSHHLPRQSRRHTAHKEHDHRAMVSAASLRMHGKLFAMSSEKKLSCLVPMDALEGDVICVIFGCSFPLVLRRIGKRYWLVGEAYVHDIMNGQTMNDCQRGKYKMEDFALE